MTLIQMINCLLDIMSSFLDMLGSVSLSAGITMLSFIIVVLIVNVIAKVFWR